MQKAIFALLLVCIASTAFGQLIQMPSEPLKQPEQTGGSLDDKINHLQQAAEHLEAAGLNEEAKKIRQMVDGEKTPTVIVQLSVVEVPLTKLDELGITLIKEVPNGPSNTAKSAQVKSINKDSAGPIMGSRMLKESDRHLSVLKALIKDNVARIITEPMIVTESGHKASLRLGGQSVPISLKNDITQEDLKKLNTMLERFKNLGTKIDVTPVVTDKETVRVSMKGIFSELDEKNGVSIAGATLPGVKTREFSTTCDIKNGYVMVMTGLEQLANATSGEEEVEQVALMCLIKTEIVEPDNKIATRPHSNSLLR